MTAPIDSSLPVVPARRLLEAAPMCPWRQPVADMAAFFPGATNYRTETLILTSHFREFKTLLGRLPTPDENPLYVHRVFANSRQIGSVVTRRVKGEYGAMEIVLAIKDGEVTGLRIQRMREPAHIARALGAAWLQSFVGKTMNSDWNIGVHIPALAQTSARAIVEGARNSLILHEVGKGG